MFAPMRPTPTNPMLEIMREGRGIDPRRFNVSTREERIVFLLLAHRGQHGAVVVGIGVPIQQVAPGGGHQRVEHRDVPALGHVQDALEHAAPPVSPSPRRRPVAGTLHPVNLGAPELLIVLLIILLIFGGSKLPQLARSLGKAQSEFKKGSEEDASSTGTGDSSPSA